MKLFSVRFAFLIHYLSFLGILEQIATTLLWQTVVLFLPWAFHYPFTTAGSCLIRRDACEQFATQAHWEVSPLTCQRAKFIDGLGFGHLGKVRRTVSSAPPTPPFLSISAATEDRCLLRWRTSRPTSGGGLSQNRKSLRRALTSPVGSLTRCW